MLSSVQTKNPSSVSLCPLLLRLPFYVQLFFFKGSAGSWTVCRIVALTACDINAVSFDLIVSGNFFFFYWGGTAVKFNTFIMKPGLSGSRTNTRANTHTHPACAVPVVIILSTPHC